MRKDRDFVGALARGVEILTAFNGQEVWLGNGEISERVGLAKPTVSRLTRTLTVLGYLHYSPGTRKYRLAPPVIALGYAVMAEIDVREIARTKLQALADRFNGVITLAARDGYELVHLETFHSSTGLVSLRINTHTNLPIAEVAFGHALLSSLPEGERDQILVNLAAQYGARWARIGGLVGEGFKSIEKTGFCTTLGRWPRDIHTVGVSLRLPGGGQPLSIGFVGVVDQTHRDQLYQKIGPRLVEVAREIELKLPPY